MKQAVLAFDLGASAGRVMLGYLSDKRLKYKEIHRFPNIPVTLNDRVYWDFLNLYENLILGLRKASLLKQFKICSLGIDTWGVDYGWIDNKGRLFSNPIHYRDKRVNTIIDNLHNIISEKELYEFTGIKFMSCNSIYQIYYDIFVDKVLECGAEKILFMPDLFNYFLTGKMAWEYTISSTSSLFGSNEKSWCKEIFEKLQIPPSIVGEIVKPPNVLEELSKNLQKELDLPGLKIINTTSHDTASAFVGSPINKKKSVFVANGTWVIVGQEVENAIITPLSHSFGFTNEGGGFGKIRFLKNITGLWILQQLKTKWDKQGFGLDFPQMSQMGFNTLFDSAIDSAAECFIHPNDMEKQIKNFCKNSGQTIPYTKTEIVKTAYNGIAKKYVETIEELEKISSEKKENIIFVGGGIQDEYLCSLCAKMLNKPVNAGPIEASVFGNIAVQMIGLKLIDNVFDARDLIEKSFEKKTYNP